MATARKIPISVGKNRADPLEPVTGLASDCNCDVRKRDEIARSTRWTSPIALRACRLPEQVVWGAFDPARAPRSRCDALRAVSRDPRTRDRTRRSPTTSPRVTATPSATTARLAVAVRHRPAALHGRCVHTRTIAHLDRHPRRNAPRGSPARRRADRRPLGPRSADLRPTAAQAVRVARAPANGLPIRARVLRRAGGAAHRAAWTRSRTTPAAHARAMTWART